LVGTRNGIWSGSAMGGIVAGDRNLETEKSVSGMRLLGIAKQIPAVLSSYFIYYYASKLVKNGRGRRKEEGGRRKEKKRKEMKFILYQRSPFAIYGL
jgi:hypothetical protein